MTDPVSAALGALDSLRFATFDEKARHELSKLTYDQRQDLKLHGRVVMLRPPRFQEVMVLSMR